MLAAAMGWVLMEHVAIDAVVRASSQVPAAADYFHPYVAYPASSRPEAVAIGDLNNDGRNDVALITGFNSDATNDFSLFVFLQSGGGTLLSPVRYPVGGTHGTVSGTVDVGDLNGDGRDDVVVGRNTGSIFVLLQNTGGTLNPGVSYPAASRTHRVRIGDFDSNGLMDVASIGPEADTPNIFIHTQNASGGLVQAATYVGVHGSFDDLTAADLNGDGRDDLAISTARMSTPSAYVLLQQPQGLFGAGTNYSIGSAQSSGFGGVGAGDVNGDGRNELALSYGGNQPNAGIGLWFQNLSGALIGPTPRASYHVPGAVEMADVDSNLRADVVVLHVGWERLGVYRQQFDGTLADEELFPIPGGTSYSPHGLAVGDVNGDGANDAVIADSNAGLVVLLQNPRVPTGVRTSLTPEGIKVEWSSSGGQAWEVYRKAPGGDFVLIANPIAPRTWDTSVTPGTAYVYRVREVTLAGQPVSDYSASDIGTAISFTDSPLVQRSTTLKAVHIQELRTTVNAVRSLAGLPAATFTDNILAGVTARAVHITELRTALDEAYVALSMPLSVYSGPVAAGSSIKAAHVQELRSRLQ